MNEIPWGTALAVFLGTLPMLAVFLWSAIDMRCERRRRE